MQTYIKENNEYIKINPIRAMYLDYLNNFLSVDCFAEHYYLTVEEAHIVVNAGRNIQADFQYMFEKDKEYKRKLIVTQEREALDKINKDYWANYA